ncbi:MAG: chromosome segregation protein SMC [Candidatus Dormibacteraeota bacterium]|nr:chromosome segregation protein SMC [Candidatus Dormibacteraeota bacterium]MBV9524270.1 chromosome segregation protein SMC [Candidatus Dormibacteraeota bacterium]
MRLRRLTIAGFKTFASRSEIGFDRGITAIVGPNGSGKSNLVDALRWALGETNARELRGQRMDEVVYAGGGKRPRLGVAEVHLVIDNDEGRLPVADPEVQLSRRVVRGAADTEYRLNGERARLRDIENLLGATGLTQNGYAVVAQNDIDAIIEATPTQRRALVEQAAGVRAWRAACEEAGRRVSQAEQVVLRIEDLLADAEPRLAELALQAEAALAQRELAERLAQLRGSLAREEWRAARGRLKQAQRRLEQSQSRWEAAMEAEAEFAARAQAARARLESLRRERDAARHDLETARVAAERAGADARQWHERLRAAVLRRGMARREETAAAGDAAVAAAAAARSGPAASGDAAGVERVRERCERLRADEAAAAGELDRAEEALRSAGAAVAAALGAQREAEAALREARLHLELVRGAAPGSDADVAAAASGAEAAGAALRDAEARAAAAAEAVQAGDAELVRAQEAAEAAWEEVNAAEEQSAEASRAARERLAAAAEAHGRLTGALGGDGGVSRAVARGALRATRLAECVSVRDPRDAAAVAAALEGHEAAWVVPSADEAAAFLEAHGPREELLDGDGAGSRRPVAGRYAMDAIDVLPEAAAAVARLLEGVALVDNPDEARTAVQGGARLAVLPDGRVFAAHRVRGGSPGQAITFAGDDREAQRALAEALAAEAAAIAAAAGARERLNRVEEAVTAAATSAQRLRAEAAAAAATLAGRRGEVDAAERRRDGATTAREAREKEEAAAAAAEARAEERVGEAFAELERVRREAGAAEAEVEHRRADRAAAEAAAQQGALELARAEGALAEAAARREELEQAVRLAQGRRETARATMADAEGDAVLALALGHEARQRMAAAAEAVASAQQAAGELASPLDDVERVLVSLEAEHAEVAVSLARAEDERAAALAEVAQAEAELTRLTEAAREEADDDSADWDPAVAERAEREIVRLERRIASLGPVNALAPAQHEVLQQRVTAWRDHHDDLDGACRDVHTIARRLAAELERRFDTVFEAVSAQFQAVFAELFPGGRATLRLEESVVDADEEIAEDVAERRPGVEILAQPPGKRLGPLRLLSGGERALTALAVVLALQQVNPSPFYVFDEVDAALDDSNVLRFTRLLRRLAAEQQFIVVTHNHITMAAADVLWGVTIDSDGVSTVIGVRFNAESSAPATVTGLQRIPTRAVR